jgi:hypothetical protein
MAAAIRKHISQIQSVLAGGKFLFALTFKPADLKKVTFYAQVTTSDAAGVSTNPVVSYLSDLRGNLAVFKSVDDAVKQVMSIAPANAVVKVVDLDTDDYMSTDSTNPVTAAKSEVKRLTKSIATLTANETKAATTLTQIASFDGGTPTQQAKYDDAEAALAAITAAKTAMTSRKNALDTFIAANE